MPKGFERKIAIARYKYQKKLELLKQKHSEEDGDIESDDVDEMERIYVGIIINNKENKYVIVKYINRGTFSRIWLCYNLANEKFYTLKIYFTDNIDEYKDECKTLSYINQHNTTDFIKMHEHFITTDIDNKQHYVIVMDYYGLSINSIHEDYELSLNDIKYIIKELLTKLKILHSINIFHADIKLDNILTNFFEEDDTKFIEELTKLNIKQHYTDIVNSNLPENYNTLDKQRRKHIVRKIKKNINKQFKDYVYQKTNELYNESSDDNSDDDSDRDSVNATIDLRKYKLYLIDFSNSILMNDLDEDDEYEIRAYRSPENILGYKPTEKAEVWAVGCALWELLTNDFIFEPELIGDYTDRDRNQLALMFKYIGKMDIDYALDAPRADELFYMPDEYSNIKLKIKGVKNKITREDLMTKLREKCDAELLNDKDATEIIEFLKSVWCYDINKRYSIDECLNSSFLN